MQCGKMASVDTPALVDDARSRCLGTGICARPFPLFAPAYHTMAHISPHQRSHLTNRATLSVLCLGYPCQIVNEGRMTQPSLLLWCKDGQIPQTEWWT